MVLIVGGTVYWTRKPPRTPQGFAPPVVPPAEVLPPARHVAPLRTPTPRAEGPQHAHAQGGHGAPITGPAPAVARQQEWPKSAAVQSYGGRDAATGAAAAAPAAEIRQSEILLRMETRMSSAACGCGPWVLGAVSSSRRRSGLEAARCARNAPPYDQLITCSSRSRNWNRRGTMHSLGQIELWWARADYSVHHGDGECSPVDLQQT